MSDRFVMKVSGVGLVSTNDAYRPTYRGRKLFYRRSRELIKFQEEFGAKLAEYREPLQVFVSQKKSEMPHLGLILKLILVFPRDVYFYKRRPDGLRPHDASNFIKAIEDQVSKALGVDDKYNVQVSAVKCYSEEAEAPEVHIILECADYADYCAPKIMEYYGLEG